MKNILILSLVLAIVGIFSGFSVFAQTAKGENAVVEDCPKPSDAQVKEISVVANETPTEEPTAKSIKDKK